MDTLLLNVYEAFKPMADEKQIALSVELPEQVLPRVSVTENAFHRFSGF